MSTLKVAYGLAAAALLTACATVQVAAPESVAAGPGLGAPVTEAQVAALDISIGPDGVGLPEGRGAVEQGAAVYALHCQSCHGPEGANGLPGVPRLSRGIGSLASGTPLKTVNSYWPYATGVFDYVRRAMPPTNTRALDADDLYAVTAYILSLDGVVPADATLDAASLSRVAMPNRDGLMAWWPTPVTPSE